MVINMEKRVIYSFFFLLLSFNAVLLTQSVKAAPSTMECIVCHEDVSTRWNESYHAITQADVADELSSDDVGLTPSEVIDDEDCIACHAPTATQANGGMTEAQALGYFFTTTDGKFTASTSVNHTDEWPNVFCTSCHDVPSDHPLSKPQLASYNSQTGSYQVVNSSTELCGQCHGNLRFPDTDHLSYNILTGTGGAGVTDTKTMPGTTCVDCHMYVSDVDGSNSASYHGHTFSVTVTEGNGNDTISCKQCHSTMDSARVNEIISDDRSSFAALNATAQEEVDTAIQAMNNVTDSALQNMLSEAQSNLAYADSDESVGFHNNDFLTLLLQDAYVKAMKIKSAVLQQSVTSLKTRNAELKNTLANLQNEINTIKGANTQQTYVEIVLGVCLVISIAVIVMGKRKTV